MHRWTALGLMVAAVLPPVAVAVKQDPPAESRTAGIRRMYSTNRCNFGDGIRAVAGLLDGAAAGEAFAATRRRLVDAGVMPDAWDDIEASELTKGKLAYMLCGALKIRGGLTIAIAGLNPRYALRETIYIGIIERGSTEEFVSGRELIDVVRRAEIYRKEGSLDSIRK